MTYTRNLYIDSTVSALSTSGTAGTSYMFLLQVMTLTSKYACPGGGGGLSAGSILLIM